MGANIIRSLHGLHSTGARRAGAGGEPARAGGSSLPPQGVQGDGVDAAISGRRGWSPAPICEPKGENDESEVDTQEGNYLRLGLLAPRPPVGSYMIPKLNEVCVFSFVVC